MNWKVTYSDGTVETFYDLSLELLAEYVDDKKKVIVIELIN